MEIYVSSGNAKFSYNSTVPYVPYNSKISFSANIGTKLTLINIWSAFYAFISLKPQVHTNSMTI